MICLFFTYLNPITVSARLYIFLGSRQFFLKFSYLSPKFSYSIPQVILKLFGGLSQIFLTWFTPRNESIERQVIIKKKISRFSQVFPTFPQIFLVLRQFLSILLLDQHQSFWPKPLKICDIISRERIFYHLSIVPFMLLSSFMFQVHSRFFHSSFLDFPFKLLTGVTGFLPKVPFLVFFQLIPSFLPSTKFLPRLFFACLFKVFFQDHFHSIFLVSSSLLTPVQFKSPTN